jgi:hypothetical protein
MGICFSWQVITPPGNGKTVREIRKPKRNSLFLPGNQKWLTGKKDPRKEFKKVAGNSLFLQGI